MALAERFPQTLSLGLELRGKVAAFTRARIRALRAAQPGRFGNVACVRGNAMKHLPHFFRRGQVRPRNPAGPPKHSLEFLRSLETPKTLSTPQKLPGISVCSETAPKTHSTTLTLSGNSVSSESPKTLSTPQNSPEFLSPPKPSGPLKTPWNF